MEQAAETLGARRLTVVRRVTLGLAAPRLRAAAPRRQGAPDPDTDAAARPNPPVPSKGPPDDHQERLPPGDLPLRGRRHGQAGSPPRRAGPRRPDGVISQALYFRGGNTTDELITVVLMRDGVPMRYFPIGAKGDVHVPLRVVEDLDGGTVDRAARWPRPTGCSGTVVVDLGTGGALMSALEQTYLDAGPGPAARSAWSSSATAWPAPAPSRRSSPAAAPSSSRSPCSATSRTATTTGSCSATCCPARRATSDIFLNTLDWYADNGITLHAGVRVDADRPVRQGGVRRRRPDHAVRQADHRHRQPLVHARRWTGMYRPGRAETAARRLRVPHHRRHPGDDRLRPARRAPQGRRRSAAACSAWRPPAGCRATGSTVDVVHAGST